MLMLGHGTRQVEKDLLLVLLWLVSMMAMIRYTCNRQAHSPPPWLLHHSTSTRLKEEKGIQKFHWRGPLRWAFNH